MTTAPSSLPAWQRGYDLEALKRIAAIFAEHDEGLLYGAFTKVSELSVADWLAEGRLLISPDGESAALASSLVGQRKPVKDFSGAVRCYAEPGDVWVKRVGYRDRDEAWQEALSMLRSLAPAQEASLFGPSGRVWVELFVERPADLALARELGLSQACTKIPASSELIGVFCSGGLPDLRPALPEEELGLTQLPVAFEPSELLAELEALEVSYEQHYSSKNKRQSWAALSLRGYAPPGEPADPEFIAKPAEMSKKWKRENPEKLAWELADSPLRAQLPSFEPIISCFPGAHRIRLMRLAPGGGELARHADITDADAGVEDGKLLRVHLPLKTNPAVRFECWLLSGERQEARMGAGEAWVLDTRKPHTAVNGGSEERIHLVIDCESSGELRRLLRAGSAS